MITRNFLTSVPFIIFLIIALTSCKEGKLKSSDTTFPDKSQIKSVTTNKDSLILTLTKQILTSLKDKDFKKFSEFIHPATGVRFSPYAYIDTTSDVKLTANEILDQIQKQNKLDWGSFDGSGDPILLTVIEYFNKFVYNVDFLNAEKRSVNKMIGGGNSLNNLESIYYDCDYTESYFSGFDKRFEGMDWCCIRLVFKNYNDKYYLVGIVHDQWTI
jgi:hypothetical protein